MSNIKVIAFDGYLKSGKNERATTAYGTSQKKGIFAEYGNGLQATVGSDRTKVIVSSGMASLNGLTIELEKQEEHTSPTYPNNTKIIFALRGYASTEGEKTFYAIDQTDGQIKQMSVPAIKEPEFIFIAGSTVNYPTLKDDSMLKGESAVCDLELGRFEVQDGSIINFDTSHIQQLETDLLVKILTLQNGKQDIVNPKPFKGRVEIQNGTDNYPLTLQSSAVVKNIAIEDSSGNAEWVQSFNVDQEKMQIYRMPDWKRLFEVYMNGKAYTTRGILAQEDDLESNFILAWSGSKFMYEGDLIKLNLGGNTMSEVIAIVYEFSQYLEGAPVDGGWCQVPAFNGDGIADAFYKTLSYQSLSNVGQGIWATKRMNIQNDGNIRGQTKKGLEWTDQVVLRNVYVKYAKRGAINYKNIDKVATQGAREVEALRQKAIADPKFNYKNIEDNGLNTQGGKNAIR